MEIELEHQISIKINIKWWQIKKSSFSLYVNCLSHSDNSQMVSIDIHRTVYPLAEIGPQVNQGLWVLVFLMPKLASRNLTVTLAVAYYLHL